MSGFRHLRLSVSLAANVYSLTNPAGRSRNSPMRFSRSGTAIYVPSAHRPDRSQYSLLQGSGESPISSPPGIRAGSGWWVWLQRAAHWAGVR
jgi:hypothetical protein